MQNTIGPRTAEADRLHAMKYRGPNEPFEEAMFRVAFALSDGPPHYHALKDILLEQRFCPGGRIQGSAGATRKTTMYNCFVSGTIGDSLVEPELDGSIMDMLKEAAATSKLGGGIGYDFSTLRPHGDHVLKIESYATGPVSFMEYFNTVGLGVASSGHRRGAQMAVLRIDHPDVEAFVAAKQGTPAQQAIRAVARSLPDAERAAVEQQLQTFNPLQGFNVSLAITDEFMEALDADRPFSLRFGGRVYKEVSARALWEKVMRATYDWAEPGVIFIDAVNRMNPLWYCEKIAATNPCGEQPLPPYGACLLGSFNLTKYLTRLPGNGGDSPAWSFDYAQLAKDVPPVVRAMDNVVDRSLYPLARQRQEAQDKRRMGLGVMGLANAGEALGSPYGSREFLRFEETVMKLIRDESYRASARLAQEKGAFRLFDAEGYLEGPFVKALPDDVREDIRKYGIRNSHLTSVAPTGTISMCADNVSSGCEPVIFHEATRTINTPAGPTRVTVQDYGVAFLGVRGRLSHEVSADQHVEVLLSAQRYVDSAVSKTINMDGRTMGWAEFQGIYEKVWKGGGKGCTTFNASGRRMALITGNAGPGPAAKDDGPTCEVNLETGQRSCE